jgi:hypothetical protein
LSADYSNREWDSQDEDGFDPYWGVIDEASLQEKDLRGNAHFLVSQLAPLLGHHAPKCGLLCGLAQAAGISIDSVTRPGRVCVCAARSNFIAVPCLGMVGTGAGPSCSAASAWSTRR